MSVATGGQAVYTADLSSIGTHTVTAAYNGNANCGVSHDETTVVISADPVPPTPCLLACGGLINFDVGDVHHEVFTTRVEGHPSTTTIAKVDQGLGRSSAVGRGDLTSGQWGRLELLPPVGKKSGRSRGRVSGLTHAWFGTNTASSPRGRGEGIERCDFSEIAAAGCDTSGPGGAVVDGRAAQAVTVLALDPNRGRVSVPLWRSRGG
jgi:hypothetical protein